MRKFACEIKFLVRKFSCENYLRLSYLLLNPRKYITFPLLIHSVSLLMNIQLKFHWKYSSCINTPGHWTTIPLIDFSPTGFHHCSRCGRISILQLLKCKDFFRWVSPLQPLWPYFYSSCWSSTTFFTVLGFTIAGLLWPYFYSRCSS